ncbi:MAG: DUF1648 domain-containing protein [Cephaloticoccus sp.]
MPRIFRGLFFLLVLAALAQAAWHYAHLPAQVATHFNLEGQADGWSSRQAHVALQAGLALGLGLLFGNLGRILRRLPDSLINLPNRDYWIAPAQRAATFQALEAMGCACGLAILGFFMLLFQQVYTANLTGRLELQLGPLLISQFLFVTGLVIIMMFRFRRPDAAKAGSGRRR